MKFKPKKKNGFNIFKEYARCFAYIKESKIFLFIIIWIFLLSAIIGFLIPTPGGIYNAIMKFIKELLVETHGMSQYELIQFIILNNIKSTFFGILSGLVLGIFPLLSTVVNGYVLGFVSLISVNSEGALTLWRILPHGVFELPAVFISLGLGLKFGTFIFKKNKLKYFVDYLIDSLRTFILVIIPLLIIAGIIEGTLIALIH